MGQRRVALGGAGAVTGTGWASGWPASDATLVRCGARGGGRVSGRVAIAVVVICGRGSQLARNLPALGVLRGSCVQLRIVNLQHKINE